MRRPARATPPCRNDLDRTASAIGNGASVGGTTAGATDAIAFGTLAAANGVNSVAIGNAASATLANSVALGQGSTTTGASDICGNAANGVAYNAGALAAGSGNVVFGRQRRQRTADPERRRRRGERHLDRRHSTAVSSIAW